MEILLIIAAFLAGGDGEEASVSSVRDIFQLCASEMKSQVHSTHLVSGLSHSWVFVLRGGMPASHFTGDNTLC